MKWKLVARPGFAGRKKKEFVALFDSKYGAGNWKYAWQWGNKFMSREQAWKKYEDAYYEYFKKNPSALAWLIERASDVYDTARSNVKSKYDYNIQETRSNHIQDIAIRRVVRRLGKRFKGKKLLQVRWIESEGYFLNPGNLPFHLPGMIYKGKVGNLRGEKPWWNPGTIEDFYQRNKVVLAKVN